MYWGIWLLIFSFTFRTLGTFYVAGLTINQIIIVGLIFVAIVKKLFFKQKAYRFEWFELSLIAFGVYLWISAFLVSPDSSWGIRVSLDYIRALVCYYLVIFLVDSRNKILLTALGFTLACFAMSLTSDIMQAVRPGLSFQLHTREGLSGMADSYNIYSLFTLMTIPFAYYSIKNMNRYIFKLLFVGIAAVLSVATLFSGSRGAILSYLFMCAFIVYVEFSREKKKISLTQIMTLAVVATGIVAFFLYKGGSEMLSSLLPAITGEGKMDASLSGRLRLNIKFFQMFLEHPIFGIGIDTSRHIYLHHVTHNQWLQILSELGIIGFTLALFIVYGLLSALKKTEKFLNELNETSVRNIVRGLAATIATIFIWGLYANLGLLAQNKLLFMLFGLTIVAKQYAESKENEDESKPRS